MCMRPQLRLFLGSIGGVALLALLFFLLVWPLPHSPVPATPISNSIVNENAHPGTTSWQFPYDAGATTQIQAYASATSVAPGLVRGLRWPPDERAGQSNRAGPRLL